MRRLPAGSIFDGMLCLESSKNQVVRFLISEVRAGKAGGIAKSNRNSMLLVERKAASFIRLLKRELTNDEMNAIRIIECVNPEVMSPDIRDEAVRIFNSVTEEVYKVREKAKTERTAAIRKRMEDLWAEKAGRQPSMMDVY